MLGGLLAMSAKEIDRLAARRVAVWPRVSSRYLASEMTVPTAA